MNSCSSKEPTILQRVVVGGKGEDADESSKSDLVLLLLGCEANPPYGPYLHTAALFMDLICLALEQEFASSSSTASSSSVKVVIKVYETSNGNFPDPQEYISCDGVILPGSFNSAYDEESWILKLKEVIQTELVAKQIPTLGVCFGHQLYAHSFYPDGSATKCLAGHQAGRRSSKLTDAGFKYLAQQIEKDDNDDCDDGNDDGGAGAGAGDPFQLYYTHGDMVDKLPSGAVNLGGNDPVPIQTALYYARDDDGDDSDKDNKQDEKQQQQLQTDKPIIAVTFQAHPEYGTSKELGLDRTLKQILGMMEKRGSLSSVERQQAEIDADQEFENVQKKSIETMVRVMKLLRWSP